MIIVPFFRGPLNDLYHCQGFSPVPDTLARRIPPSALFGVLELNFADETATITTNNGFTPPSVQSTDDADERKLLDHYRELSEDTKLESEETES